ncbi:DUF3307 domain-containing protein [Cecembia rubra]|uniref:Uncharacterized protein DUF3307 n=1 Tax=Cecembia rubra TaxID=1485585 RepID=A0A2P8EAT4_9BACT|nr:DUF3307 domain-containing protein [Cecembia rubra]PSL06581.1 uncharacterized protein DUF3307 [Cecembia rubra]
MIILLKLILAHFIGDFLLQTKKWVIAKELKKARSWQLYVHSISHGLIPWALIWDFDFWPLALFLAVSHFHIDWMKLIFQKSNNMVFWFLFDQGMHFLVLVGVAQFWTGGIWLNWGHLMSQTFLTVMTAFVFLLIVAPIVIGVLLKGWSLAIQENEDDSLANAGKYIGILERLLVFVFILIDQWEAVGFLIAAKSIFRFGDLKESKDRKLTEYILIGTLLSFGIAIVTGIITAYLIKTA